jgi:hypothetical protein
MGFVKLQRPSGKFDAKCPIKVGFVSLARASEPSKRIISNLVASKAGA